MTKTYCDECGKLFTSDDETETIVTERYRIRLLIYGSDTTRYHCHNLCTRCALILLQQLPHPGDADWPNDIDDSTDKKPFIWRGR